jgi:hypothetical protein
MLAAFCLLFCHTALAMEHAKIQPRKINCQPLYLHLNLISERVQQKQLQTRCLDTLVKFLLWLTSSKCFYFSNSDFPHLENKNLGLHLQNCSHKTVYYSKMYFPNVRHNLLTEVPSPVKVIVASLEQVNIFGRNVPLYLMPWKMI